MDKLQLDSDEGILLQATEVERYGEKEVTLDELILTNKNIFFIYRKKNGMFSKSEKIVDKIPLKSIKVINGKAQIMKITHPEYEDVVQILLKSNRREFFSFFDCKEEIEWINTINTTITGDETPLIVEEPKKKKGLFVRRGQNVTDAEAQRSSVKMVAESEQIDHKSGNDSTSSKLDTQNAVKTEVNQNNDALKLTSNDAPNTIFCWNCGTKHAYGAKFCSECGASIQIENKPKPTEKFRMKEQHQQSTYSERKQKFAGKIIKCPVCGQELSSTDAICPSCGHEMNEVRIHPILEKFISELNECDFNIAQEKMASTSETLKKKLGWSYWKTSIKVLWVALNCFTLCAPLVLYYVAIKNKHNDTSNTNIKLSLIGNFQIPNEREAIIATLSFIRGKIIALTSQKIKKETWRWIKLWSAKASQIHKQAVELLPNDEIVENIYSDIVLETRKAKKAFNIKVLLTFFSVVVYISVICCFDTFLLRHISHGDFDSSNKDHRKDEQIDEKESVKWSDMFLSEYFPEPMLTNAHVYSNSKEECNIGQIDCSQSEYYAYCRQCKEWGFDYEIVEEDDTWFTAYNSEGYKVHVSYIGSNLSVELNAPMEMSDFSWPESEIGQIVPIPQSTYGKISWEYDSGFLVYVGNMSHENFSEYASLLHESGFNIDARKGDYYFRADNADGFHISIEYKGFNIVWLRADAPDDK